MEESIPVEIIEQAIYVIRGCKVMLDRDLARLYGVKTMVLNQAVKRNRSRFPSDFMFSLTREEILRISQIVISSGKESGNLKYSKNVMAFTENGVAMLSGVLNSPRAIQANIQIMRTFTRMRELVRSHEDLVKRINRMESRYNRSFKIVFDAIRGLIESPAPEKRIEGFRT